MLALTSHIQVIKLSIVKYICTMRRFTVEFMFFSALATLVGCKKTDNQYAIKSAPTFSEAEHYPAGDATVSYLPRASFELPAANLPQALKSEFYAGKALANQPWVKAPTITTARDGLGPIYNARTCLACHINGGKGLVPESTDQPLFSAFVRVSLPGEGEKEQGALFLTQYGDQLQTQSVALAHQLQKNWPDKIKNDVAPEAYVYLKWKTKNFIYPDGDSVTLRWPELDIRHLAYGSLPEETLTSLRVAPAIMGAGLIELIPQSSINALADADDKNGDGISGRVNKVWDAVTQSTQSGRFGLKANRPNMDMVVAGAFANDIGVTNPLFPGQPCTKMQASCLNQPSGDDAEGVELPQHLLNLVINFNRNVGVPARRKIHGEAGIRGREIFYQIGCSLCHQPSFKTAKSDVYPHLSEQTIWPYSDFLLHDMGKDLADGRPDFGASGSEWRTPPLWGVGLSQEVNGSNALLHDGRAKTVEEAILWHGGEAEQSKTLFVGLTKTDRDALIRFVNSL
ncbi:di-heme oxidoredictase family protein [Teredinibacter sp. KSP-S5-2]|uniref:di-heme oxidoreductase family protein n=1 Tax=Teredinibacter sp. KSP-S5-2 TaxID=3034506 RepID=UPI00293452A9|nr:di-heme oxidoredictase family protein [Teredinibacter sp. KSP-S5-2]WNO10639.1 di-heme oxidoredictase family protein [Teredinibacter sp. KSP-S5-2]